jgi:putative addiction module component (TIGR02574 family)
MPLTLEQLRDEVLALPVEQRDWLFSSTSPDPESVPFTLSPAWRAEIDRRMERFESGQSQLIPWETVEQELDSLDDLA